MYGVTTCATVAVGIAHVLCSIIHDDAVDNIQRFLVSVQGRGTTDTHVDESAQLGVARVDIDTGGVSLQQMVDAGIEDSLVAVDGN